MKVLLATPQDRTVLGTVGDYCRKALESLGHEVCVFDFRRRSRHGSRLTAYIKSLLRQLIPSTISPYNIPIVILASDKRINEELLDRARAIKPDLFLVLLGENITPESVEAIKRMGAVTANWLFDSIVLPHRLDFMQKVARSYDHIFLIDSPDVLDKVDLKANHIDSIPLGCDPDIHNRISLSPEDIKKYGCDIAFVGTVTPEREKVLEGLSDLDIKIWGRWQSRSARLDGHYQDKDVYGSEAVKIYNAAKVVVDIHGQFGLRDNIFNVTPRLFEVPASGALLITNNIPQARTLYKAGEEIVVYDDAASLRERIEYYLSHEEERKAIAERGYKRAHLDHTYAQRLTKLLKIAGRG